MNFKPRDSKVICSSVSCEFDRFLICWLPGLNVVYERTQRLFTGSTIPRRDVFSTGSSSDLIPFNMSHSSKVRKFCCRVLDFRYIFLIFISRQNKLVCAQRAPKKITRFVSLRVHLLEIRRLGSWNTLPRRRSGIFSSSSYFLHDKCLYL